MKKREMKTIELPSFTLEYELRRHARAKRTNITLHPSGRVVVTIPSRATERAATMLIKRLQPWIIRNLEKVKARDVIHLPKMLVRHKKEARSILSARVDHFNGYYKFSFNRIAIRSQRTVWGSCSQNKNLNFNSCLIFLPDYLRDYVIVHELCHLKELNHSKEYWRLVGRLVPRYKECEKKLKGFVIS